jgi:hypothetical protein
MNDLATASVNRMCTLALQAIETLATSPNFKDLADPKLCPNAPTDVQNQALMFLGGKKAGGALIIQTTTSELMNGATPAIMGIDGISTSDSSSQVIVVKKQKATGTLAGMVDYPLTEEQKKQADVKLLWYH